MSNRPMKKGDRKQLQKRIDEKMARRKKTMIDPLPPYIYIVAEGTVTEVRYLEGFADMINRRFRAYSSRRRVVIRGFGRSCLRLLEEAVATVGTACPNAEEIWLVYDKDDFPADDFDNTQFSAQSYNDHRRIRVAWSNECVELWFLLHFQDLIVNIGREGYLGLLERHCDYGKTDADIFKKMLGGIRDAVSRAERLYARYEPDTPPSAMCPAARMHELVRILMKYADLT